MNSQPSIVTWKGRFIALRSSSAVQAKLQRVNSHCKAMEVLIASLPDCVCFYIVCWLLPGSEHSRWVHLSVTLGNCGQCFVDTLGSATPAGPVAQWRVKRLQSISPPSPEKRCRLPSSPLSLICKCRSRTHSSSDEVERHL
jgi:hypothetical protein